VVSKVKIVLLGDGAVGKTSLMRRFVFNQFDERYISTIGVNVVKKQVSVDGSDILFLIWDILGQKEREDLQNSYFVGAMGAMLVCDLTRRDTFDSLEDWIERLQEEVSDIPLVILGNKQDLFIQGASSADTEIRDLAARHDAVSFLTSAKTGLNVEHAYAELGHRMIEHWGLK